jgi:hypothetical protein
MTADRRHPNHIDLIDRSGRGGPAEDRSDGFEYDLEAFASCRASPRATDRDGQRRYRRRNWPGHGDVFLLDPQK